MISGALTVLEPWVPIDQIEREIAVVGRGLSQYGESLLLMADVPLGWDGSEPSQLLIVRPRSTGDTFLNTTTIYVNGTVWGGRTGDGCKFAGKLELEDVVPPTGPTLPLSDGPLEL